MPILADVITTLDFGAPVRDLRMGPFQTAVLSRECGLASTPHDHGPHHGTPPVPDAGRLLARSARDLAGLATSASPHEAAVGMAAVNSLLRVDADACRELNAGDLLAERGTGRPVAVVGHFPFVPRLAGIAGELWVIERNPRDDDRPEHEAAQLIPRADVVAITGTAFVNHTIDGLLALCRPDAYVVVVGGTAPMSPVLFDHGVDAICGTRIVDPDAALRCVSQGATYRQIAGTRQLAMLR